jgi:hypothetical protein
LSLLSKHKGTHLAIGWWQASLELSTHFFMKGQQYLPFAHCSLFKHCWHCPRLCFSTHGMTVVAGSGVLGIGAAVVAGAGVVAAGPLVVAGASASMTNFCQSP